jgi:hypothetical protein
MLSALYVTDYFARNIWERKCFCIWVFNYFVLFSSLYLTVSPIAAIEVSSVNRIINPFESDGRYTHHLNNNYYQVLLSGFHIGVVLTLIYFGQWHCLDAAVLLTLWRSLLSPLSRQIWQYSSHLDDITLNMINFRSCLSHGLFSKVSNVSVYNSVEFSPSGKYYCKPDHNKKRVKSYWKV